MNPQPSNSIEDRLQLLRKRWEMYVADGEFEQFVEFAVAVNSLAEYFSRIRLAGLVRLCEGLENAALDKLGDETTHPIEKKDILALQRQVDTLFGSVATSRQPATERRADRLIETQAEIDWIKPRSVWMIAAPVKITVSHALGSQLSYFGFNVIEMTWGESLPAGDVPLAVLFFPEQESTQQNEFVAISAIRSCCPASQLFYMGVEATVEPIVALMRCGIDTTIPLGAQPSVVLNNILDLVRTNIEEQFRVLVVDDSKVAAAVTVRTLKEHDINTHVIHDPGTLIEALESYHPDLILMDMCMPRFNGIEATRVLRQMELYRSIPIVYLSGESAVGMQVEALRLGGDQFLSKPFNPVLLAAVVKTKIERSREAQRSTRLDGLTGLFNHTAAKSRLHAMVSQLDPNASLTVAMIDIDNFKAINDTYGHPVGDLVIRGLAWLLKGRLRSIDLVGRYGGEEFLIALPEVSPAKAKCAIDRIRQDFSKLPHTHANGALYSSFSAGVASFPLVHTAAGLTEAADGALLQAKRLGRNRVETAALS